MPTQRPSISAFFPAYNDGGTIGSLVVTTLNTLAELTDDYEVVVVENGSTDYTVEVLEELAKQFDHFRFLAHREALGYGGALRVGFATCRKDLIFTPMAMPSTIRVRLSSCCQPWSMGWMLSTAGRSSAMIRCTGL